MSDISEHETSNTLEELREALSSEVGKAEGGSKIGTTPAEKEDRSVNKSPSREINVEDDLKTTILNLSEQIRELQQELSSTRDLLHKRSPPQAS